MIGLLRRLLIGRDRQGVGRSWMGRIRRIRRGMGDLIWGLISSNFAHGRKSRGGLEMLRRRKELCQRPSHRSVLDGALSGVDRCAQHINHSIIVTTKKTKITIIIINNVVKGCHHIIKITF